MFLGYIGLFALPQLSPAGPSTSAVASAEKPRAMIALVPYIRGSNNHPGTNGTLAEPAPQSATPVPEPEVRLDPSVQVETPVPEPAAPEVAPVAEAIPEPEPVAAPAVVLEPVPDPIVEQPTQPAAPSVDVADPVPEGVEDFGAPVEPASVPVRKPEPRIPVAPASTARVAAVVVTSANRRSASDLTVSSRSCRSCPGSPPLEPQRTEPSHQPRSGPGRAGERIVERTSIAGIVLFAPTIEQPG